MVSFFSLFYLRRDIAGWDIGWEPANRVRLHSWSKLILNSLPFLASPSWSIHFLNARNESFRGSSTGACLVEVYLLIFFFLMFNVYIQPYGYDRPSLKYMSYHGHILHRACRVNIPSAVLRLCHYQTVTPNRRKFRARIPACLGKKKSSARPSCWATLARQCTFRVCVCVQCNAHNPIPVIEYKHSHRVAVVQSDYWDGIWESSRFVPFRGWCYLWWSSSFQGEVSSYTPGRRGISGMVLRTYRRGRLGWCWDWVGVEKGIRLVLWISLMP